MPLALIQQALAAIFLIVFGATAWAQTGDGPRPVPPLTGHVIDQTGTLSAAQADALAARLQALERERGSQVVVLMVPGTAPEDIAAFANRVGNAWKIGRRDVGDGVLVLVAKDERRMRIEVAKALEGAIPDIAAARIIDAAMKPRFQQGDFAGGLDAAITQISARIAGEALPLPPAERNQGRNDAGANWEDLAIFLFVGVMVGGPLVRSLLGNRLGGVLLGAGVGATAFAFTTSMLLAAGAGLIALLYTWLFAGRSGPVLQGGSGGFGGWGGGGGSGWGRGGSGGGFGGFGGSGGGGDFGGGGASGGW